MTMRHAPQLLAERIADWEAEQRADWIAAGRPQEFENWQETRRAAALREREAQLNAEWLAEQRARRMRACEQYIPARYRDAGRPDAQVAAWCDQFARADNRAGATVHGPSLLLLGATGRGKTHQAFAAVRHLVAAGLPNTVTTVTAVDLYAQLRPRPGTDSEAVFAQHAGAGLLLLDDLGAAKGSEWVEEINYRLINHRYNNELPTVITSNVPPKDLGVALGERVASRLIEMTSTVVLKGADRRRVRPQSGDHQ